MTSAGAGGEDLPRTFPERVGKYRVDGVLGRGAMGVVYKGYDARIDRAVAIKTLRADVISTLAERSELLKRFSNEARWAGRCNHPNIVTVFDFVEQDDAPFIIMEYVEAGTLDDVIRSGARLPLRQVNEVMVQLLQALDHAHSKGVIHRDVKPANILCPSAASIKVTDFGVARIDVLNQTGTGVVGTPNYMSPEQLLGRAVDARTDLFAAAIVLFQLLTGSRPFPANALPELIGKLVNEAPPALSTLRPGQWGELDRLLRRALAPHPSERYQSASDFIEALNDAMSSIAVATEEPRLDLTTTSTRLEPGTSDSDPMRRTMSQRLRPETLSSMEQSLAFRIGPIAKVLVGRMVREARDEQRLLQMLSDALADQTEAERFRSEIQAAFQRDGGIHGIEAAMKISEAEQGRAVEALLPLIGPIARALARKEASQAYGLADYYGRLASFIPDEQQRARFLAAHARDTGSRPS